MKQNYELLENNQVVWSFSFVYFLICIDKTFIHYDVFNQTIQAMC